MTEDKPALNAKWIDPRALDIIKCLQRKGYSTYLVGGCVRDLLLGIYPKDFDIATSAPPSTNSKNYSKQLCDWSKVLFGIS